MICPSLVFYCGHTNNGEKDILNQICIDFTNEKIEVEKSFVFDTLFLSNRQKKHFCKF